MPILRNFIKGNYVRLLAAFFIGAVFSASGCATAKLSGEDKIINRGGYLTSVDIETFCDQLVTALLESEKMKHYIISYQRRENEMPVIDVHKFQNMSDEDFDASIISEKLVNSFVKSGYFLENADTEPKQAVIGRPEIFAEGEVRIIVEKIERVQKRTFYISARIISAERDRVLWKYEATIQKEIRNS